MKNKKMVLWIAMLITAIIPVYAQQYDSDKDFQIDWDDNGGVKIVQYIGSKKEVSIPPAIQNNIVTGIGGGAFKDNKNITKVTIPNSVTRILAGDEYSGAFSGCTSLASVNIPNSITSIGRNAFLGCASLTGITIPNSVTSIGGGAFSGCIKLTRVTIPGSVKAINGKYRSGWYDQGRGAFEFCTGLTSVTIENGVNTIGWAAFSGCTSLPSITIPDSVTIIEQAAFSGCTRFTSVTIPGNVESIGIGAFEKCTGLTSVIIQNGVESIGGSAFSGCNRITSINIPESVSVIGYTAFFNCTSLTSVTFQGSISFDGFFPADYSRNNVFPGDLRDRYFSDDGGPGTYTRFANGSTWRRQDFTLFSQPQTTAQPMKKLIVWSFTDELSSMIKNYYMKTHTDVEVEYTQIPTNRFQTRIDPVLAVGQGTPDIIALESAFVRKYVESGLLLDITDIYQANKSKLLAYPVEIGTYNGKVYALSWQACPGAMFYRRSLAIKYLGTDDPKTVQAYFTNFNKFLETAKMLKDKSNGSCVVVSSFGDLLNPFLSARKDPWVVNNKLVIDPAMEQYMDICKQLHDNSWEGRVGQWSEDWFEGMKGRLRNEYGSRLEVFSYFLPTWGLHYVLKANAPETSGDWAMIQGPSPYRWGGTWVGAYKGTKNVAVVKEFIRYVTTDDAFLEAWAKDTGDMVSNVNVINKIKDTYVEPYLKGQNHYAEFAEMAKNVNGKLIQKSDEPIEAMFNEALYAFVNGEKTKEQALADFRRQAEAYIRN